jgi:hypothetical protein
MKMLTILLALLTNGCAVTDPNWNGGVTVYNPLTCEGRGGHYHQDENGVTCHETTDHTDAVD